jgi:acetyl-CoA acyltransferase
MSLIPMGGNKPSPNPWLAANYPASLLTMGLTAERVARHYGISRDDQDAFALASHQKAVAAQAAGRFTEELIPVPVMSVPGTRPERSRESLSHRKDLFRRRRPPRRHFRRSPLATQARLSRAGHRHRRQLLANLRRRRRHRLMEAAARANSEFTPLARLVSYAVTGCLPEEMGIGPITPFPKPSLAGLTLNDIGLIELNEAFAAQVLAIIRALDLDPTRINVNGGAIALGHPLGCTGAKLTATLLQEMKARSARYGMVTMCVGGGMGAAGIFERLRLICTDLALCYLCEAIRIVRHSEFLVPLRPRSLGTPSS